MTDRTGPHADLLHQRLAMVANLSALTASALKLTQSLAGTELDILRLELEIGRDGAAEELVRELRGIEGKAEAIRATQAQIDETIAKAEHAVAEIDTLLAAGNGT